VSDGDGKEHSGAHSREHAVFISYASPDGAVALSVCEALESVGVNCWIAPRDATPGKFYADEIVHAIDEAKAMVLILSKNAAASPHVLREVERATSKRHPVVSLRTDQAPLPAGLEYFLNTSHWLDASGQEIACVMPKLVAAVRLAIEMPTNSDVSIIATAATPSPTSYPAGAVRTRRHMTIVAGYLMAAAIVGLVASRAWQSAHQLAAPATLATAVASAVPASPVIPEKSVAVLPFVDMSAKKDQEYFSDGMAEEIIDLLVKVPELRVPARTSAFSFKGKSDDIPTIARKLYVSHVLEGSVRMSGKHLRVTAQLVRADNGYHVWSETYDRDLNDIFKVQDEIAGAVVEALKVNLRTGLLFAQPSTPNPDAHALFLRGKFVLRRLNKEDTDKAVDYLRGALDLDPNYALAWSWLSVAYDTQGSFHSISREEACRKVRFASEHAGELDPTLADAHVNIGSYHMSCDRDWVAANTELAKALELDRGDARAWGLLGHLALVKGDFTEAMKNLKRAAELDPLRPPTYEALMNAYWVTGRLKDAENAARKVLELAPADEGGYANLGLIVFSHGRVEEALAAIEREPDEKSRLIARSIIYQRIHRHAQADEALAELLERHADDAVEIADVYAEQGQADRAFDWLQRAFSGDPSAVNLIKADPHFLNLHGDQRYGALLGQMKLPD